MHLGQAEYHIGLCAVAELHQLPDNRFVFEIGKFFRNKLSLCLDTGRFLKIIIAAKVIFIQQQVNLLTSLATEMLFICSNNFFALFTAMITGGFYDGM